MSSGIRRSVRGFSDARILERILFALEQRFEIQAGAVAIFGRVRAQTVERRLRQSAKPADVCLLRIGEAAGVLAEDGLNARFDFSVALGRKLRQVRGLLRSVARRIGRAPAKVGGCYGCVFI